MKLFIHTKIYLTGTIDDDEQFFIYAKDKRDAQKQWYDATGEKLALCAFTAIPKKRNTNIFSYNKLQGYLPKKKSKI